MVSFGHACLEVPSGWAPWATGQRLPSEGLALSSGTQRGRLRAAAELVPEGQLTQQTLPGDIGQPPRTGALPLGPIAA